MGLLVHENVILGSVSAFQFTLLYDVRQIFVPVYIHIMEQKSQEIQ